MTSEAKWQPIETAPKDGSWILLFRDGKVVVGTWERLSYNWEPEWCYGAQDIEHAFRSGFHEPTHWMPLPEPPK